MYRHYLAVHGHNAGVVYAVKLDKKNDLYLFLYKYFRLGITIHNCVTGQNSDRGFVSLFELFTYFFRNNYVLLPA